MSLQEKPFASIRRRLLWLIIIWTAWELRLPGLFANTFHADEALFATWARFIAIWKDPLLLTQAVDKPPLLFYLQALFYPLNGPVTWAARLPNLIASTLMIPLVGRLAGLLYRQSNVVIITAVLFTLSPLAIQFSATAFIDPLLLCLLVTAMLFTVPVQIGGSPWRSGFLWGLGLATKYQALLFFPLLVGLGLLGRWRRKDWLRWIQGAFPPVLALITWDVVRSGAFQLWRRQISNYGGLRWSFSPEFVSHLRTWWALSWYLLPWPLLILGGVYLLSILYSRKDHKQEESLSYDSLFGLFLVAYTGVHLILAVPVWDRYLLLLLPFTVLIVARGLWSFYSFLSKKYLAMIVFLLFGFWLLGNGVHARDGRFPIGGFPTADGGANQIAEALAEAPYGTVLYDHWYSWQWRYHFFDKRVYVSWFPTEESLKMDLEVFGRDNNQRYIALPADETAVPVQRAISNAGFSLALVQSAGNIRLYALVPE